MSSSRLTSGYIGIYSSRNIWNNLGLKTKNTLFFLANELKIYILHLKMLKIVGKNLSLAEFTVFMPSSNNFWKHLQKYVPMLMHRVWVLWCLQGPCREKLVIRNWVRMTPTLQLSLSLALSLSSSLTQSFMLTISQLSSLFYLLLSFKILKGNSCCNVACFSFAFQPSLKFEIWSVLNEI